MRINGEILKKIRLELDMSQEQLSEKLFMSSRHISRIENGEKGIDIWQFVSLMQLLGYANEDFWLLYLESQEYEIYKLFIKAKRLSRDGKIDELKEVLSSLEKNDISKYSFLAQYVLFLKITVNDILSYKEKKDLFYKAIKMSIMNFDESKIKEYRLTYVEISILNGIAKAYADNEERERAIDILYSIIENIKNSKMSEEDKARIFPYIMFNLSNDLGKEKRYKECIKICNEAIELCQEYNNFNTLPNLLLNIASCLRILGEESQIYKPYLVRSYHTAYAMGFFKDAQKTKKEALEKFGIEIE